MIKEGQEPDKEVYKSFILSRFTVASVIYLCKEQLNFFFFFEKDNLYLIVFTIIYTYSGKL